MKTNLKILKLLIFLGAIFLAIALLAACAPASPTPTALPPTAVPPTAVPPTNAPPTAVPATEAPTKIPPTPTAAATADPHVAGADCVSCHTEEHIRWSTTLHAADPAAVLTNEEHNKAELLTDECISCHAPFQAAKFHVADFVQPVDQIGPWNVVAANGKAWQAITCTVCHDPTSKVPFKLAFFDAATQKYAPVQTSTELCEKCHQAGTDDSRDLKGSVHEGLACATCHFQKGTAMSLDPKQSCANCHPTVNPKHPDVTKLNTTYLSADSPNNIHFIICATCHPNGTPTETK